MSTEPNKIDTELWIHVDAGKTTPERLDVFLTNKLNNATRNKVQEGIKEGRVVVNGKKPKASYVVQPNDAILCIIAKAPPIEVIPENIPLDIVFEDEHLIVLNKPMHMVVHPAYGNRNGTLINALLYHLGISTIQLNDEEGEIDGEIPLSTATAAPQFKGDLTVRPGLVHRLDKDTTGLMVIAKNDFVHAHLAHQFAERTIQRRYKAIVWGIPNPLEGRIESYLGRDKKDRKLVAVVPENQGKYALTHYKTLDFTAHNALLEFKLATGRTHQIRVHAKHIGHPLFGDVSYGGNQILKGLNAGTRRAFFYNLFEILPRQALHAYCLGFTHPATKESLYFESELPQDMQIVWDKLKAFEKETIR